ncbi:MAG: hypothetical protein MK098_09165 [Marinovum sp.]|nr:hypothetical protein [Marinovum sp.]
MAETGYNGLSVPRIVDAGETMQTVLPEVAGLRDMGLMVYGPGEQIQCENVNLHFPPMPEAEGAILSVIENAKPAGHTALAKATRMAAEALGNGRVPATLMLITDGKDTCYGRPCALAAELAPSDLKVHMIGFRVHADALNWKGGDAGPEDEKIPAIARCLADETGGVYVSANSLHELIEALRETLGCNFFSALTGPQDPRFN